MKAIDFSVVLFVMPYEVVVTVKSVKGTLRVGDINESYRAINSSGNV